MRRVALVTVLVALLAGCGDDAGAAPDREDFESAVAAQYGATADEAACIADYAYADYDDEAIQVLAEDGVAALPQALWEPFVTATIACTLDPTELEP